jgi:hypothetical protein
MGRLPSLTPEIQERICGAIRIGATYRCSAKYAGINRATFFVWMKKGRTQKRGLYRDFHSAVRKANAEAEVAAVRAIWQAGQNGDWKAAAWWLERRNPQRWALRDRKQFAEVLDRMRALRKQIQEVQKGREQKVPV